MTGDNWKTMTDFAAGIDTNRLPATDRLGGRNLTLALSDGTTMRLAFRDDGQVTWSGPGEASGTDPYEAIEVRQGVYFIDQTYAEDPQVSRTTLLKTGSGHALVVTSRIGDKQVPGTPRVSQTFTTATVADSTPTGKAPAPSRDLIGRRALYRYSPDHLYEHVYLSSERYAWQCLIGEQRGHGDVDLASTWGLGDGLYCFTFREFRIPVASVWIHDLTGLRTTGKFFGLDQEGKIHNSPGGGHIIPLGRVSYPIDGQPV